MSAITHPEKVLVPDSGITKGELCAYYEAVAPLMIPHLRGRPITMERFPAGIEKKGFIQKDVSKGFPSWLERGSAALSPGPSIESTVSLVLAALTLRASLTRIPKSQFLKLFPRS